MGFIRLVILALILIVLRVDCFSNQASKAPIEMGEILAAIRDDLSKISGTWRCKDSNSTLEIDLHLFSFKGAGSLSLLDEKTFYVGFPMKFMDANMLYTVIVRDIDVSGGNDDLKGPFLSISKESLHGDGKIEVFVFTREASE